MRVKNKKAHVGRRHAAHQHRDGMLSIDYYAYASKIRGWNPGFKVGFALGLLIFGIAADSVWVSLLIFLGMAWLTVGKGGLKLSRYISFLTVPLVFILMSSAAIACNFSFTAQGDYRLHLGFFYVYTTVEGLEQTGRIVMKALGAVSCMYMMSLSTPVTEIVNVLGRAHMPALITELMHMIYRYIFILLEVQNKMTIAAKSRLGYRDLKTSYLSFGHTLSNLLVVSMRRANAYYDALESRCYDGELCFLEEEKPLRAAQVAPATGFAAVLLAVWIWTRLG